MDERAFLTEAQSVLLHTVELATGDVRLRAIVLLDEIEQRLDVIREDEYVPDLNNAVVG